MSLGRFRKDFTKSDTFALTPPELLHEEMRGELDGFRARLRQAWIRRATRILSLQPITPSVIAAAGDFRDKEWEERER